MINKICLNNFVLDGKWRPIGGEGSGRGTRCVGKSSVCCSLIIDSGGSAIWDSD